MARIIGEPIIVRFENDEDYAKKLYSWERCITYGQKLSYMEAVDLVEDICSDYYVSPPIVTFYPKDSDGDPCYDVHSHIIWLPKNACYTSIIVHECAHVIFEVYGNALALPHGPEFVALLCELYCQYLYESGMITIEGYKLSEQYLKRSASENGGLDVADSWFSIGSAAFYLGVDEYAIEMLCDQ